MTFGMWRYDGEEKILPGESHDHNGQCNPLFMFIYGTIHHLIIKDSIHASFNGKVGMIYAHKS